MKIVLHKKNILNIVEADTIVLPVDGSTEPGMAGNVARQFLKHVDVEMLEDLYCPPPHVPWNGHCHWSSIEGRFEQTHFKWICALGILSKHKNVDHRGYLRSALREMFADRRVGRVLACPVLSAGWRIKPADAIGIMLAEAKGHELHIVTLDEKVYQVARALIPADPGHSDRR